MKKELQKIIQNFSTKHPDFTVSYGQDDRTKIDVLMTSEYIKISYDIGAYPREKEKLNDPDWSWKNEFEDLPWMETTRHYVFLDAENANKYFVIFFDRKTNELFIENAENIPTNSIRRIIQDYSVIAEAFNKILVEYKERGIDFLRKTYPWVRPGYWDRGDGEIHVSHDGGFSIYHFNFYADGSGRWEFDSVLEKGTVRQCKRVLKYK